MTRLLLHRGCTGGSVPVGNREQGRTQVAGTNDKRARGSVTDMHSEVVVAYHRAVSVRRTLGRPPLSLGQRQERGVIL